PALAATHFTRGADHGALAAAGRTRPYLHELSEHRSCGATHLATATAGATGHGSGALACPAAVAGVAGRQRLDLDVALDPGRHFLQRQLDGDLHVLAAPRICTRLATTEDPL